MPLKFLEGVTRTRFEATLPDLLKAQRWFGGKAREVAATQIVDRIPIPAEHMEFLLLFLYVTYRDGGGETYALPLAFAFGEEARRISRDMPRAVLSSLAADDTEDHPEGLLYDAMWNPFATQTLLRAIGHGAQFAGENGTLQASSTTAYETFVPSHGLGTPRVLSAEQSNTSVAFGEQAILKLYRRVQPGVNPDWEIGRYLTSRGFPHSPAVGGAIEYVRPGETSTVALLQAFVRNQGDAWAAMLKDVDGFLRRASAHTLPIDSEGGTASSLWDLARSPLSGPGRELIGPALEAAGCLGRRTAALHLVLAEAQDHPDFAPEALTLEYRQARYQSMLRMWKQVARLLTQRLVGGTQSQQQAADLLAQESRLLAVFETFLDLQHGGQRIRCHGDYHLGQVLWTGSDYVLTDFEGEPDRPLYERRLKHSPLYDVAGMLRSFDYASWTALNKCDVEDTQHKLESWVTYWSRWVRARFLGEYLTQMHDAPFWPPSSKDAEQLLTVHELEKAVYELGYELNNRPEWVGIPLKGIHEIVRRSGARAAA